MIFAGAATGVWAQIIPDIGDLTTESFGGLNLNHSVSEGVRSRNNLARHSGFSRLLGMDI
jgi:hypothetical protein